VQSQYDYGLRTVINIIKVAGALRQSCEDATEETIILRAINSSNLPKFVSGDIPLFKGIMRDLIPGA
jgi:dynein heavy chain